MFVGLVGATACGGGTPDTSPSSSPSASTVQAYQAVGQEMTSSITTYHGDTSTMPDSAACQAAWEKYQAAMALELGHMQEMSPVMDEHMGDDGHHGVADMSCVANAMAAEFQRHAAAACAAHEVVADRGEAGEHVATMTEWMEHQRVRYQELGSTMGMMSPPSETTWTCHQNPDGSYTMGDHTWSPTDPHPADPHPTDPHPTDPTPTPTPWPPCDCHDGRCG